MKSVARKTSGILSIAFGIYLVIIIPKIFKEVKANHISYIVSYFTPIVFIALGVKVIFFKKIDQSISKYYGSLSKRIFAFSIDCLILSAPYLILYYYLPDFYIIFIVVTMPIIPFISLFFLIKFEATPGKIIFGLKVLNENFKKLTIRQAVLRTFIDILFGIILTIGYIQAMFAIGINPLEKMNLDEYFDNLQKNFSTFYNFFDTLNYFWLMSEFIVINFNFKKKAIHDYIANSVVVNIHQIKKEI